MESYVAFAVFFLCPVLWLAEAVSGKTPRTVRGWIYRTVPVSVVLLTLLLDYLYCHRQIPVSLLAADALLLDAVFLRSFADPEAKGLKPAVAAFLAAAVCLTFSILRLSGRLDVSRPAVFTAAVTALLLALCTTYDMMHTAGFRRADARGLAGFPELKVVLSVWLIFAGVLICALSASPGVAGAAALKVLCLLLMALYVYLYCVSGFRKGAASAQPVEPVARPVEKMQREEILFRRIDEYMQRERPYLDDSFDMEGLSRAVFSNKSMVSRAVNGFSGNNFCQYVNRYRIQYAVSLMQKDQRLKIHEIALACGFRSVVSFNMAFRLFMNDIPSEYMRTLKAGELHRQAKDGQAGR